MPSDGDHDVPDGGRLLDNLRGIRQRRFFVRSVTPGSRMRRWKPGAPTEIVRLPLPGRETRFHARSVSAKHGLAPTIANARLCSSAALWKPGSDVSLEALPFTILGRALSSRETRWEPARRSILRAARLTFPERRQRPHRRSWECGWRSAISRGASCGAGRLHGARRRLRNSSVEAIESSARLSNPARGYRTQSEALESSARLSNPERHLDLQRLLLLQDDTPTNRQDTQGGHRSSTVPKCRAIDGAPCEDPASPPSAP